MLKETPTPEKVREETKNELIRLKKLRENTLNNPPLRKKKGKGIKKDIKNIIKNKEKGNKIPTEIGKMKKNTFNKKNFIKKQNQIIINNN